MRFLIGWNRMGDGAREIKMVMSGSILCVGHTPKCPPPINCKKKRGTCKHEVVFSKHYDKSLCSKYADHVKAKISTVEIDPNYAS